MLKPDESQNINSSIRQQTRSSSIESSERHSVVEDADDCMEPNAAAVLGVDDEYDYELERKVIMPVEENTTVDSEGFSGAVNNAEIGDEEENFTDPIFESELAEFKLRLAQTIEPVASTMTSQPE